MTLECFSLLRETSHKVFYSSPVTPHHQTTSETSCRRKKIFFVKL